MLPRGRLTKKSCESERTVEKQAKMLGRGSRRRNDLYRDLNPAFGVWDVIYYKRPEEGTFRFPTGNVTVVTVRAADLTMLLDGVYRCNLYKADY
jgi:hypothetical protein